MLSSPFLPVYRGDELAESHTHADGIIGNIAAGGTGQTDIKLIDPYEQFVVLEAKLYSRLSGGTTKAPGYDQVARSIACMGEVIKQNDCSVEGFQSLGFYVLAPECQITKESTFKEYMQKDLVEQKVRQRVETYKGRSDYESKKKWFEECFEPLLPKIDLGLISWEVVVNSISNYDQETGEKLNLFYKRCLKFNARN